MKKKKVRKKMMMKKVEYGVQVYHGVPSATKIEGCISGLKAEGKYLTDRPCVHVLSEEKVLILFYWCRKTPLKKEDEK